MPNPKPRLFISDVTTRSWQYEECLSSWDRLLSLRSSALRLKILLKNLHHYFWGTKEKRRNTTERIIYRFRDKDPNRSYKTHNSMQTCPIPWTRDSSRWMKQSLALHSHTKAFLSVSFFQWLWTVWVENIKNEVQGCATTRWNHITYAGWVLTITRFHRACWFVFRSRAISWSRIAKCWGTVSSLLHRWQNYWLFRNARQLSIGSTYDVGDELKNRLNSRASCYHAAKSILSSSVPSQILG